MRKYKKVFNLLVKKLHFPKYKKNVFWKDTRNILRKKQWALGPESGSGSPVIYYRSKNLTYFTNLNSLNIVKNILPQHSQKPILLNKFSRKHVSGWCHKKHLHGTISRRSRTASSNHWESKFLYVPVYLRKKTFAPET